MSNSSAGNIKVFYLIWCISHQFSGLPLVLLPEETHLLVRKGFAMLVDGEEVKGPDEQTRKRLKEFEEKSYVGQVKVGGAIKRVIGQTLMIHYATPARGIMGFTARPRAMMAAQGL
jgi:hypothetical protein